MKTLKIYGEGKGYNKEYTACGMCFSLIEYEDKYCRSCGAGYEATDEDILANGWEDLKKYNK